MFAVCVTFVIKPAAMPKFLPIMRENARASFEDEPGCHQFDVCVDSKNNTVFLYELYTDEEAFQVHQTMEHFLRFDQESSGSVDDKSVTTYSVVDHNAGSASAPSPTAP